MQGPLAIVCGLLPRGATFSLVRLLCNALNTTKRYRNRSGGGLISDCPWCGHLGGDAIWHLCSCPRLRAAFRELWPRLCLPVTEDAAAKYYCLIDEPGTQETAIRFLVAVLVVEGYQSGVSTPYVVRKLVECFEARITKWILCRGNGYAKIWQGLQDRQPGHGF